MSNEMKDWLWDNEQEKKIMMNREQRRAYAKRIKNNKAVCECPNCHHPSLFYSTKRADEETAIVCEVCGATVIQNEYVTRSVPPGIYLPFTLTVFEDILENAKKMEQEKENKE